MIRTRERLSRGGGLRRPGTAGIGQVLELRLSAGELGFDLPGHGALKKISVMPTGYSSRTSQAL